jgi:hypothetical protein
MVTQNTQQIVLIITMDRAVTDLPSRRFVNYLTQVCGNAQKSAGVIERDISAGELTSAIVEGIVLVETGGAFPKGAPVTSDAQGRARLAVGAEPVNGYSREVSPGAGELAPIHLK